MSNVRSHQDPAKENGRHKDVDDPCNQCCFLPSDGCRGDLPALSNENENKNEEPIRYEIEGLSHVQQCGHTHSVLGEDTVVCHHQGDVE